jgi:hypothetical protein
MSRIDNDLRLCTCNPFFSGMYNRAALCMRAPLRSARTPIVLKINGNGFFTYKDYINGNIEAYKKS